MKRFHFFPNTKFKKKLKIRLNTTLKERLDSDKLLHEQAEMLYKRKQYQLEI